MRIAVLVLAGLGILTSGGLGFKWFNDSRSPEAQIAMQLGLKQAMNLDPGSHPNLYSRPGVFA